MKWYYKVGGGHTYVRVFMNGAKCGDLCFRNEEFKFLREAEVIREARCRMIIEFINEGEPSEPPNYPTHAPNNDAYNSD